MTDAPGSVEPFRISETHSHSVRLGIACRLYRRPLFPVPKYNTQEELEKKDIRDFFLFEGLWNRRDRSVAIIEFGDRALTSLNDTAE